MILKGIMKSGVLKAAEKYAKSESSKPLIPWFISENKIDMTEYGNYSYHSYAEFFSRQKLKKYSKTDFSDKHLISPCDGFLSAYRLSDDSSFAIKGSRYRVSDLLNVSKTEFVLFSGLRPVIIIAIAILMIATSMTAIILKENFTAFSRLPWKTIRYLP